MFHSSSDIKTYTLAGNATLTLASEVSGKHYTFKVRQATDKQTGETKPLWFVSLLSGPDNTSDYTYMGVLRESHEFGLTGKSAYKADSIPVRGFQFFWKNIMADKMPPQMKVQHEGHCGRCGRPLTHPESIERGIGPDCAAMMGLV